MIFFKNKFLEDINSFRGATDTPVLDLWRPLGVSKPEWAAFSFLAETYVSDYIDLLHDLLGAPVSPGHEEDGSASFGSFV